MKEMLIQTHLVLHIDNTVSIETGTQEDLQKQLHCRWKISQNISKKSFLLKYKTVFQEYALATKVVVHDDKTARVWNGYYDYSDYCCAKLKIDSICSRTLSKTKRINQNECD